VLITADLPLFNQHYDVPNQANIIEFLTFDEDTPTPSLAAWRHP